MSIVNLIVAGVGGQGVLTAARVIALAAYLSGYEVRMSEVHGLAQRGGAMVSMIRFGTRVLTPVFSSGEGDYLVGLELLESLRNLHLLKPGGCAVVCTTIIPLAIANLADRGYPTVAECLEVLNKHVRDLIIVEREKVLPRLSSPIMLNMVVIGALAAKLKGEIPVDGFTAAIREATKKPKDNLLAFRLGFRFARGG